MDPCLEVQSQTSGGCSTWPLLVKEMSSSTSSASLLLSSGLRSPILPSVDGRQHGPGARSREGALVEEIHCSLRGLFDSVVRSQPQSTNLVYQAIQVLHGDNVPGPSRPLSGSLVCQLGLWECVRIGTFQLLRGFVVFSPFCWSTMCFSSPSSRS